MNYVYDGPGKPPRQAPTMQDSLDLYNNALKVIDFYNKNGYQKSRPDINLKNTAHEKIFKQLDTDNDVFNMYKNTKFNDKTKPTITTKKGKTNYSDVEYRKNLDKNKFLQRESAHSILNLDSPMQLFDRRIKPQLEQGYNNYGRGTNNIANDYLYGDVAEIYSYDPIAVKPVKLLTPKERAERERKYGSISKTTPVQRTVHAPIELLQPKQVQMLAKLNNLDQPVQLRTMPVPVMPNTSMSQSLRYPSRAGFVEKLMRKFQGKPNIPYWVDEYGNERYPKYGENTAEGVREMRRLTSDLNPQNEEDAKELARIEMLRMMSPESRKVVMSGGTLAEK